MSIYQHAYLPPGGISAGSLDMSFIEDAVRELLHSRRTLKASYGFGYYIQGNTARRIFENMQVLSPPSSLLPLPHSSPLIPPSLPSLLTPHPSQGALEEVTEMLAEVVARPHLRKPRSEIIRLTREAREKRLRLVRDIKAGLP